MGEESAELFETIPGLKGADVSELGARSYF